MKRGLIITAVVCGLLAGPFAMLAQATPDYAKKEKKVCGYCHLTSGGGGERGFRGMFYTKHKNSFKGYIEAVQAKKAGVKPGAMASASRPKKPYTGK